LLSSHHGVLASVEGGWSKQRLVPARRQRKALVLAYEWSLSSTLTASADFEDDGEEGRGFGVVALMLREERLGYERSSSLGSVFAGIEALASKAMRNASGSAFPRFSARRRIPAQAFALK